MKWRVAQVILANDNYVDIHYEAWPNKYDEAKVHVTSSKLAAFRSCTVGYTGPIRSSIRNFQYNKLEKVSIESRLRHLIHKKFHTKETGTNITQFIRGTLFVYVDSLLSILHNSKPNISELQEIFAFIEVVFEFIVQWIQAFPEFYDFFMASQEFPRLPFVDGEAAISMCYRELAEILKTALGCDPTRCGNSCEYVVKIFTGSESKAELNVANSVRWCSEQYLGMLKKVQGLESIVSMIDSENTGRFSYPVEVFIRFLEPLSLLKEDKELKASFFLPAAKAFEKRFSEFNKQDIKEIEKYGMSAFLNIIETIMKKAEVSSNNIRNNIDNWVFNGYLQSANPSFRITGIKLLKERISLSTLLKDYKQIAPDKLLSHISTIQNLKILNMIFKEFPNSSLINEVFDIVKLLILMDSFVDSDIELVWECFSNGNPEIQTAILNLIASIVGYAPYSIIEQFHFKISKIPLAEYSITLLDFLSKYLTNVRINIAARQPEALKTIALYKKENENLSKTGQPLKTIPRYLIPENYSLYNYDILWDLLAGTKDSKIDLQVKEKAADYLVFNIKNDQLLLKNYQIKSIYAIEKNPDSSLRLMNLLKLLSNALIVEHKVKNTLLEINKTYNLFAKSFQLFMKYKLIANETFARIHPENPMKFIFQGENSHEDYIRGYFEYLELIIDQATAYFVNEQISEMWSQFVFHALCEEEKDLFFSCLNRSKLDPTKSGVKYTLVNDANCTELFCNYFQNNEKFVLSNISSTAYYCYKRLMIRHNLLKKYLKEDNGQLRTMNSNIQGISTLWKMVFNSKEAREDGISFLIQLYFSLYKEEKADLSLIISSYGTLSVQHTVSPDLIPVFLKMLKNFLLRFDDFRNFKIDKKAYKTPPSTQRRCTVYRPDGTKMMFGNSEQLIITIRESMNILDLRKAISYKLKIMRSQFRLLTAKKSVIESHQNEILIRNALIDFHVELLKPKFLQEQTPSYVFGNSSILCGKLLECMEVSPKLFKKIWKLIKTFNPKKAFVESIQCPKLGGDYSVDGWHRLLGISPRPAYILYTFHVIRKILQSQSGFDFANQFLSAMGGKFLMYHYNNYSTIKDLPIEHLRIIKYIQHSMRLMFKLVPFIDKHFENETQKTLFVYCTMDLLKNLREASQEYHFKLLKQTLHLIHTFGITFAEPAIGLLENGLVYSSNLMLYFTEPTNLRVLKNLEKCIKFYLDENKGSLYLQYIIEIMIVRPLNSIENIKQLNPNYFTLACNVLMNTRKEVILSTRLNKNVGIICNLITEYEKLKEVNFRGLIEVLNSICAKSEIKSFDKRKELIDTLLLFVFPNTSAVLNSILKDQMILPSSLRLLQRLCMNNEEDLQKICTSFFPQVSGESSWRTNRLVDWGLLPQISKEITSLNHMGLENPFNVCYMNSLLQQLFMTPIFQSGVLSADLQEADNSLLYHLQLIFGSMLTNSSSSYDATHLCGIINDFEGNPLTIFDQKDVDEFFGLILDRLESALKPTTSHSLIKNVYGGAFANEIICLDCPHKSENIENFLSLNIEISKQSSLETSLNKLIQSEALEGSNMYYCERCEKKVNAKRRSSIKVLPNILVIVLKRFEYNFDTNTRKKLNSYFEFPQQLYMEKYSEEFNLCKDLKEKCEKQNNQLTEEEAELLKYSYPSDYYDYSLKGVILHNGTAEGGHYISLIRDFESSKWFEFNDSQVVEFSLDQLAEEAFGGQQEATGILSGIDSNHEMFAKTKNAYMLIYERKSYFQHNQIFYLAGEGKLVLNPKEFFINFEESRIKEIDNVHPSPLIQSKIEEFSFKVRIKKTVLNTDFINFIGDLITNYSLVPLKDFDLLKYSKLRREKNLEELFPEYAHTLQSWNFLLHYTLTTYVRIKPNQESQLYTILCSIKKHLENNTLLCLLLLEYLSHPLVLKEFLVYCPVKQVRLFITSLLVTACQTLYKEEKTRIQVVLLTFKNNIGSMIEEIITKKTIGGQTFFVLDQECEVSVILILINNLLSLLPSVLNNDWLLYDFTFLLSRLSNLGPEIRKFFLLNHIVPISFEKLIGNLCGFTVELSEIPPLVYSKVLFDFGIPKNGGEQPKEPKQQNAKKQIRLTHTRLKFLIELLSQCFCECSINGQIFPSSTKISDLLPHQLAANEMECLNYFYDEGFLKKLFTHANNWVARTSIGNIIVHVCYNNNELSSRIVQQLIISISKADIFSIPNFIPTLQFLLCDKTYSGKERHSTFDLYCRELSQKIFADSYLPFNYLTDFFITLMICCERFREKVRENPEKYFYISKWLETNPYPISKKHYWIKTNGNIRPVLHELDSKDKAAAKEYSQRRIKLLKQLFDAKINPATLDWDTEKFNGFYEIDLSDPRAKRLSYDICLKGSWRAAKLLESADELYLFSFESSGSCTKWLRRGSDRFYTPPIYSRPSSGMLYSRFRQLSSIQLQAILICSVVACI